MYSLSTMLSQNFEVMHLAVKVMCDPQLCALLLLIIGSTHSLSPHPILIVVSYDAFRYDFFSSKDVPNMSRMRHMGAYSDYLINVFPTKTFPNHYSIATGLYPESHGVIGNSYYDTVTQKQVSISYDMFHYNDDVTPIWRRNEDMSEGRHSGVVMWPGGCYPYQNKSITYCQSYEPSMDWSKRVDLVLDWLKHPRQPANLIMLYFEEPDSEGHKHGINSEVVNNLIAKLDNVTLYLQQQLETNGLVDKVNVIHLSDHGMVDVKRSNFLNVTQYLQAGTYTYSGSSPILQFYPHKGYENDVYGRLKAMEGHFKVYKKDEYPARWRYRNSRRTPPIVVMADLGYALDDMFSTVKHYNVTVTDRSVFGVHGYDYTVKEMRPFFMARGPQIKTNHKVPPFNTVDLYNLFCEILDIAPPPNNGTKANILDILARSSGGKYSLSSILLISVVGVLVALMLVLCAAVFTLMMIKRQQSITTSAALNKRFQTVQSSIEAQHLLEPEDA